MREERYVKHCGVERLLHWSHFLCFVVLLVSGIAIYRPSLNPWADMNSARFYHFVFMYLFLFAGVAQVYHFFVSGRYKEALFQPEDARELGPTLSHYILLRGPHPDLTRYNPLQKLGYMGLFVFALIQTVTGFALYAPPYFTPLLKLMGGLGVVRVVHYLGSWVFICFVMVHLYLVLTVDIRLLLSMLLGYYYRPVEGGQQSP